MNGREVNLFDGCPEVNVDDARQWEVWAEFVIDRVKEQSQEFDRLRSSYGEAVLRLSEATERSRKAEDVAKGLEAALKARQGVSIYEPGQVVFLKRGDEPSLIACVKGVYIGPGHRVGYYVEWWDKKVRRSATLDADEVEGDPALPVFGIEGDV